MGDASTMTANPPLDPVLGGKLCSRHLSLPRSFTPDLKLISFTNPFLNSLLIPSELPSRILNLYWIKWAPPLAFVCFSFFFIISGILATCARLSWSLRFLVHVKLFFRIFRIVSYRIVLPSQRHRCVDVGDKKDTVDHVGEAAATRPFNSAADVALLETLSDVEVSVVVWRQDETFAQSFRMEALAKM